MNPAAFNPYFDGCHFSICFFDPSPSTNKNEELLEEALVEALNNPYDSILAKLEEIKIFLLSGEIDDSLCKEYNDIIIDIYNVFNEKQAIEGNSYENRIIMSLCRDLKKKLDNRSNPTDEIAPDEIVEVALEKLKEVESYLNNPFRDDFWIHVYRILIEDVQNKIEKIEIDDSVNCLLSKSSLLSQKTTEKMQWVRKRCELLLNKLNTRDVWRSWSEIRREIINRKDDEKIPQKISDAKDNALFLPKKKKYKKEIEFYEEMQAEGGTKDITWNLKHPLPEVNEIDSDFNSVSPIQWGDLDQEFEVISQKINQIEMHLNDESFDRATCRDLIKKIYDEIDLLSRDWKDEMAFIERSEKMRLKCIDLEQKIKER